MGGGQHLKTKKKEMVLTAECTVCFTFWLMHSHNLPTLFYCIYIWPHVKIYRCMCGVWPLYRTCPSDRHPDGWSCQRLCVLLIKQSNDPVCRPHTHTHSMNLQTHWDTLRNDTMKREETVKGDEGNTFFFFFAFWTDHLPGLSKKLNDSVSCLSEIQELRQWSLWPV